MAAVVRRSVVATVAAAAARSSRWVRVAGASEISTRARESEKERRVPAAVIPRVPRTCRIVGRSGYSSDARPDDNASMEDDPTPGGKKKKKVFVPRVSLLSEENELSVVTLDMAQKIAVRRNLKLVKMVDFDTKTERPTYKLMTSKEYLREGLAMKKERNESASKRVKSEKLLSLSTRISEHDFQTKLKAIVNYLKKRREIRILISVEGNVERAEALSTGISAAAKEASASVTKSTSNEKWRIHARPSKEEHGSDARNEGAGGGGGGGAER